jgi:chromosome segregation ATPase
MTKTALKQLDADIESRREQLGRLREDLEQLEDWLDGLEARRSSLGQPRLSQAEMERRYARTTKR